MPIDRADLAAGAYIRETATRRPYEVTRYRPDRGMVDLEDPMSPLTSPRVADGRSIMLAPRTRSLGVCHVEASFELLHAAPTLGEMVHPGDVADMLEWGRAGGE